MTQQTSQVISLTLCTLLTAAAGAAQQQPAGIHDTVDHYLRIQTAAFPGQVTYNVGTVDPRMALPACQALEAFTPPGARLWGNTSVGVRCRAPQPWSLYVPVTVRVVGPYVAAARGIVPGQVLTSNDITILQGDLGQLPPGALTDVTQAIGKATISPLAAAQPLRHELLRAPPVVHPGQGVKLVSQGPGFRVTSEGTALGQAAEGQTAQVRTQSGQTVTGIARAGGIVEVRY